MIPKDPVILLSYVNTQLRDYYESLEALCTCRGIKKKDLIRHPLFLCICNRKLHCSISIIHEKIVSRTNVKFL